LRDPARLALGTVALSLCVACAGRRPVSVAFIADYNVATGTAFDAIDGEVLGGLSAIVFSQDTGGWLALSDARENSRFYRLDVDLGPTDVFRVTPKGVVYFRDEDGRPFRSNALDPEGAVLTSWGTLLISTEADLRRQPFEQAKLLEFELDGTFRRSIALPSRYLVEGRPPFKGQRNNYGFEAMALSPEASWLFLGEENTLLQDGPEAGFDAMGLCRILLLRVRGESLSPEREVVYRLGPFGEEPGFGESEVSGGLVELVSLSNTSLIALERVFVQELAGAGRNVTRIRLYLLDLGEATDVSRIDHLDEDASWRPVSKELLLDLADVVVDLSPEHRSLDNFEGMTLGPRLPNGERSVVLVSDNNFQTSQRTAFLLLRLKGP
jgi:hypothetical protein